MALADRDRLQVVNDELRVARQQPASPWLPLESNPEIFTSFARQIGPTVPFSKADAENLQDKLSCFKKARLREDGFQTEGWYWRFVDVLSLNPEDVCEGGLSSLTIPPESLCAACILLFPCSEKMYAARREEYKECMQELKVGIPQTNSVRKFATPAARSLFHIEQVSSFGNACGTIAAVHTLANLDLEKIMTTGFVVGGSPQGGPTSASSSAAIVDLEMKDMTNGNSRGNEETKHGNEGRCPIADFCSSFRSHSPHQRGEALVRDPNFQIMSDRAATHNAAQTSCPSRDGPALDHHYCTFVPSSPDQQHGEENENDIRVVELDGTKPTPIDHGPMRGAGLALDFLRGVCEVVQTKFVGADPNNINFSMMALIYGPEAAGD